MSRLGGARTGAQRACMRSLGGREPIEVRGWDLFEFVDGKIRRKDSLLEDRRLNDIRDGSRPSCTRTSKSRRNRDDRTSETTVRVPRTSAAQAQEG